MFKINLGCGEKYLRGFVNTDVNRGVKADKYFDLNKFPYPFRKNQADYILMDNVLEHLDDIIAVMKETHRILKPNGIVEIIVPYFKSDGAYHDPTHRHYFSENSFDYFSDHGDFSYYTTFKFKILENKLAAKNLTVLSKLRYIIPFRKILRYLFFNMYDHIVFKLKAIK